MNNNKSISYKCARCGKIFTKFGEEAELLNELQTKLARYYDQQRKAGYDIDFQKSVYKTTSLTIVGETTKCCKYPCVIHYRRNGVL